MSEIVTIIVSILGSSFLTAIVTFWFTRRKLEAETQSQEVDASKKISEFLEQMRMDNAELIKKNIELEKLSTDLNRQLETLRARLEARDKELEAATKQLDLLRDLAKDTPITEILRKQLETVNQVVINLQSALDKGQEVIVQKEHTMQELLRTNNDLRLRKPTSSKEQAA